MLIRYGLGIVVAAWLLIVPIQQASANLIRIEPDDYAVGTDLSNPLPGVTLSTYSNVNRDGYFQFLPVTVGHDPGCAERLWLCRAVTGSNYLLGPGFVSTSWGFSTSCFTNEQVRTGNAPCANSEAWEYTANFLVISFANPTDFVQVSGAWIDDQVIARAFDANYNLVSTQAQQQYDLDRCRGSDSWTDYCANIATLTSSTRQISYVVAGSWAGIAHMDVIAFRDTPTESVPEPSTLMLFSMSLATLGMMRRKQRI